MISGLVSTVIPVYNRPELLLDAVSSVIQQSYRSIEVIIVDDGSTDSTAKVANDLSKKYSNVHTISIANSGPGVARNHGLERAQGEYIQFLDSDDLLHKDKFKQQVSGLTSQPECSVSYCIQQYCDMQGRVIHASWMRSGERHQAMFPAMLGGRVWGTPVPLYRRSILDEAGPWLALSCEEDWEYDCRIASLGVKLHYCNETLVTIRSHAGGHLGQFKAGENHKLADKTKAYIAIDAHARTAKVDVNHPYYAHFNRMCFFLARQCAEHGLVDQSKALLRLAKSSTNNSKRRIEYAAYGSLAALFGWRNIGLLSAKLDRQRS